MRDLSAIGLGDAAGRVWQQLAGAAAESEWEPGRVSSTVGRKERAGRSPDRACSPTRTREEQPIQQSLYAAVCTRLNFFFSLPSPCCTPGRMVPS